MRPAPPEAEKGGLLEPRATGQPRQRETMSQMRKQTEESLLGTLSCVTRTVIIIPLAAQVGSKALLTQLSPQVLPITPAAPQNLLSNNHHEGTQINPSLPPPTPHP